MFLSFPLVCASVQDARHTEFSLLVCSPCVGRKHTHVFAIGWTLRQAKMRNFPSTGCRCFRRPFPLTSMLRNEREANVDFAYTFDRGLYAAVPRAFHPPPSPPRLHGFLSPISFHVSAESSATATKYPDSMGGFLELLLRAEGPQLRNLPVESKRQRHFPHFIHLCLLIWILNWKQQMYIYLFIHLPHHWFRKNACLFWLCWQYVFFTKGGTGKTKEW